MNEQHDTSATSNQAEQAVKDQPDDLRDRVRRMITGDGESGRFDIASVRSSAQGVIDGVLRGVKDVSEERRDSVLGEAMSGIADALRNSANATRLAVEEAEGRGERFAEEDLKRVRSELENMGNSMSDTVRDTVTNAGESVRAQADDAQRHIERIMQDVRPSIEKALEAVRQHPARAAGDAASAGVTAATKTVGALFDVAGGILGGVADAVTRREGETHDANDDQKH